MWLYFQSATQMSRQAVEECRQEAQSIGGYLDGGTSSTLVLTIPLATGFDRIEQHMEAAVSRYPGSTWFYGNVYDPAEPDHSLNWWLS